MGKLSDLLTSETGLKDEIDSLNTLHRLATDWEDIKVQFADLDGIDDLIDLINAITNRNKEIKTGLANIGINVSQMNVISNFLSRFSGQLDDLDPDLKMLLRPVSDFAETGSRDPGEIDLPLISLEKSRASGKTLKGTQLDLTLSGEATAFLEAEAGDMLPYPGAATPGSHLRLTATGSLSAGAGARLPFTTGAVGFSASTEAGTTLSYYFKTKPKSLYALELARHLPNLNSPFDYKGLVETMSRDELDAISFKINGSAGGKVTLAIAQSVNLFTAKLPTEIGYTFSASIERSGFLDVVMRAERKPRGALEKVRMTLSRSKSTEKASSSAIRIVVDSGELFTALRDTLQDLLKDYKELVNEYQEYLTPGTWLKDQASEWAGDTLDRLIEEDAVREAIGTVFGRTNATDKFQKRIADAFENAGNRVTGFFDDQTASVKNRLKVALVQELPKPLVDVLGTRLEQLIDDGIQTIRSRLDKKIKDFSKNQVSRADAQLKKLKKARKPIKTAIDNAVTKADKLLAGVRKTLSEIEKTLQEMHDKAEKLAKAKLTIAWSETTTITDRQTIEFDASLPVTGDLQAFDHVYDQLMRGNIGDIALLLTRNDVTVHSQSLERFSGWHQKRIYNVIFMDVLVKKESIIKANATVRLEGESIAVGTTASLDRWSKSKHQQQTATFMNVIDLALLRSRPDKIERNFQFRLGLEHMEDKFQEHEVRNFLNEFESIGVISPGTTDRAVIEMETRNLIGTNERLEASIKLTMEIDESGFSRLLDLGEDPFADSISGELNRSALFRTALPLLVRTGTFTRRMKSLDKRVEKANEIIAVLASAKHITDTRDATQILMRYKSKRVAVGIGDFRGNNGQKRQGEFVVNLMEELYEILVSLRKIWVSNPVQDKRNEKWYRKKQEAVAKGLDHWMQTGDEWFGGWKKGLPQHETVAFCAIIAALAGEKDNPVRMNVTIKAPHQNQTIVVE